MNGYILLVLMSLSTGLVYAQQNIIEGRVLDPQSQGIPRVKIKLLPIDKAVYSDSTGSFAFSQVPDGSYTIACSLFGFGDERAHVKALRGRNFVVVTMHRDMHVLDEVVVAQNSIKQRKASESMNLEIVDRSFITRNLGGSLMETLSRLPGIKTIGIGSGQSKPLIRGLGFNRVVVVDKGIKHEGQQWGADHGLEIDQFAAREVELVKGAASFIYGSDAIAGVINILPFGAPEPHSVGGSVDLIGKTNNGSYGTSVNLYTRSDKWFSDARVTYQNYGDFRVPTDRVFVYDYAVDLHKNRLRNTAGHENGLHFHTGYINGNFQSTFYISNVYNKSGFFANAHGLEPRMVDTDLHDASYRDILMPSQQVNHFKVSNRSTLQVNKHLIELELGYQHNFRQEFNHYVNHGYMPPVYPDTMSISIDLERAYDKHVYSANLRDRILMGRHELTFGFNGEHQNNAIDGWSFLVPAFRQTTAGLFLYDQFRWNSRLLLHGAIRYDYSSNAMKEYRDWFDTPGNDGNNDMQRIVRAQQLSRNFKSFVWSAGLNYDLEKIALKANVGKSFRVPITKEFGANGVNYHYFSYERGDPNLSPEVSYQLDVGANLQAGNWSIGVSPFFNYFPNYIYLNPTPYHVVGPGAGNQLFQYSQSRVMRYGAELDIRYTFSSVLSTGMLAEYLYAEQLSGDKKGFGLPFSPPPSALLNLTVSPGSNKMLTEPYVSLDYRLTAPQNNIVPPEKKTKGYGLFHVQFGSTVHLFGQPLIASMQVQNIFDTKYFNHTSFYRLIELPEAGRNFVLTVKLPFDIRSTNKMIKN